MTDIPAPLRRLVRKRAGGYCEYCGADRRILVIMSVDHIRPRSRGGETDEDNLCLSCLACNGSKLNRETAIDPDTGERVSLFHPRQQRWSDHFQWKNDYTEIAGLTTTGRATIVCLDMNRPAVTAARRIWRRGGWRPPE